MNKVFKTGAVLFSVLVASCAQALSLADASAKIDEAVADPAVMTDLVKGLSASDQVAFLSRVNAAIDALPGSPAEKAANYLNANGAALKGSAKGNLSALLAETFATVPPESLTLINEQFAEKLFNRSANPSKPVSDAEMLSIATNTLAKIQARTAGGDNAAVRDTFAVLMFLRASGGSPANLRDSLLAQYADAASRELAKNDWIPAAMGEGQTKTYEPMLGASDAGDQPDAAMVMQLAGAQSSLALLAGLNAGEGASSAPSAAFVSGLRAVPDMMGDSGLDRVPRTSDRSKKWWGGYTRGEKPSEGSSEGPSEPDGYAYQHIGG